MTITNFHLPETEFLSNFYKCTVHLPNDPLVYPSAEHAYQASKTEYPKERQMVARCQSPSAARKAGQSVTQTRAFDDKAKIASMRQIIASKFDPDTHPELCALLVATGEETLIEGNSWGDTFFGRSGGKGENWLGKLLMERRQQLRDLTDPTRSF